MVAEVVVVVWVVQAKSSGDAGNKREVAVRDVLDKQSNVLSETFFCDIALKKRS